MEYTCRICLEECPDTTKLIVPCLCNGSSKYVHRSCLDIWRSVDRDNLNYGRCNECLFNYVLDDRKIKERLKKMKFQQKIDRVFYLLLPFIIGLAIGLIVVYITSFMYIKDVLTNNISFAIVYLFIFFIIGRTHNNYVVGSSIIRTAWIGFIGLADMIAEKELLNSVKHRTDLALLKRSHLPVKDFKDCENELRVIV